MTTLTHCPFCGGEAELEGKTLHGTYAVACQNLECPGVWPGWWFLTEADAIAAWNRRADTTGTTEMGEKIIAVCKECGGEAMDEFVALEADRARLQAMLDRAVEALGDEAWCPIPNATRDDCEKFADCRACRLKALDAVHPSTPFTTDEQPGGVNG